MKIPRAASVTITAVSTVAILVAALLVTGAMPLPENDYLLKIYQNIQIFGKV